MAYLDFSCAHRGGWGVYSLACVLLVVVGVGGLAPTLKNWRVLAVFGVVSALSLNGCKSALIWGVWFAWLV